MVACVPATENMPSGTATKPGDIITQLNGKTVEVNNTDAEGRLILADALTYCVRELGADRVVDLATLTGAVVIALGSTYAGADLERRRVGRARAARPAERTGELAWRLPLHPEYKELTRGKDADLTNASAKRKAATIYAGSFLEEFVDGKPWAHLDIAGTAWDVGRDYVGKGRPGSACACWCALARDLDAPMDFDLTDEQRLLRDTVREFARSEVAPVAEELDRDEALPLRDRREAGRAGADGHPVPRGVRGRRRRHALLRARDRGAGAGRLLGLHHGRRAHLARHDADPPLGNRGAEGRVAARAVQRRAGSPPSG